MVTKPLQGLIMSGTQPGGRQKLKELQDDLKAKRNELREEEQRSRESRLASDSER